MNFKILYVYSKLQLFTCIKSLKSFTVVELHPKEGTLEQDVNTAVLSGLLECLSLVVPGHMGM